MMTHGSLFSGIGGFDLAAEWMGWKNLFHCEWNEFGQKVLKYYWPDAELFTDITKSNFTKYANKIDILTGGFPCQPYSSAGKRLGKDDERHLWPEMLRVIREVKPTYIVGENVRGLTNWNGGVVFEEVCLDLENCGYEVQPILLPACSVNAPHRRDRVWFVAYSGKFRLEQRKASGIMGERQEEICGERSQSTLQSTPTSKIGITSNPDNNGFNQCNSQHEINASEGRFNALGDIGEGNGNRNAADSNSTNSEAWTQREVLGQSDRQKANGYSNVECSNKWENFPTVSPICTGDDGISDRLDSITFSKWRNESIKAGGNAIVPQVAYQIFKTIQQHENNKTKANTNV